MGKTERYRRFLEKNKEYLYRLKQNTYVVESLGLFYMDTPKTAGTSIKTRLAEISANYKRAEHSATLETVSEMFIHDRAINPLKPITAYSNEIQEEVLFSDSWRRFCVVRNPYERIFSAWFSKLLLRQPGYINTVPGYHLPGKVNRQEDIYDLFDEFISYLGEHGCRSDPHWDLQARLLLHNSINWGKVFRFENLQEELLKNVEFFGGEKITLERLNVSGYSADWTAVSSSTIELIQTIYRDDFRQYGYPLSPPDSECRVDTLAAYVNAVSGRNDRMEALINLSRQADLEIEALRRDKEALQRDKEALQRDKEAIRRDIRALNDALTETKVQLHGVVNSKSWKVTKPLRIFGRLVRNVVCRD